MCATTSPTLTTLALPVLALGVPILDTFFSMIRRFIERRSLFAPDKGHVHHRLLELGFKHRDAVLVIYIVTVGCTGLGLLMFVASEWGSLVIFVCVVALLLQFFYVAGSIRLGKAFKALQRRNAIIRVSRNEIRTFEDLQLVFRQVENTSGLWTATCKAANQLDFVWLSRKETDEQGFSQTTVWRNPNYKPEAEELILMNIPVLPTNGMSHSNLNLPSQRRVFGSGDPSRFPVWSFNR